ncbi:hypothetical protein C1H46_018487 [Malus baccata]|uniref:Pectate lyase superfamily protein domain-containing protein n=1 Tax=Malus baccata TaxID=106549 RepID=A0A540MBQ3_MALBA|nr:hypothetical protein C1H46_018487 [Malus baccata]
MLTLGANRESPSVTFLLLVIASSFFGIGFGQNGTSNALDFGATGNDIAKDTRAFFNAWERTCGTEGAKHVLKIPYGKTYQLKPLKFEGPCKVDRVKIQAIHFDQCDNLQLGGFASIDSPRNHIRMHRCNDAYISNIHITAPEDSPNTDGIAISSTSHVKVLDSVIETDGQSAEIQEDHSLCSKGYKVPKHKIAGKMARGKKLMSNSHIV